MVLPLKIKYKVEESLKFMETWIRNIEQTPISSSENKKVLL